MYIARFTITDEKTKQKVVKESKPTQYKQANEMIINYITKTKNVVNIEMLGNGNCIVYKNGGNIKCEIAKIVNG